MFSNYLPSLSIAEKIYSLGSLHDLNPQTASELPRVHPIKKSCSVAFISRIVCRALRFFSQIEQQFKIILKQQHSLAFNALINCLRAVHENTRGQKSSL